MTFLTNWEDFEKAAERLYLQDPMKVSDVQIIYHASTPVFFMRLFKDVFNLYEKDTGFKNIFKIIDIYK